MAQEAIKAQLARALDAMRGGRSDEAERALEANGGGALKTAIGQNIRGDIFLGRQRYQDALKAFDVAIRLAPSASEGYCNRGVALEALGRLEEALAAHDRALRYRPDNATAHFNRGNVLKALGRSREAIAAYGRALAARPHYAEALVNRGAALMADGRAIEALNDFGKALGLKPNLIAAHIGRASAHRELAQYDLALGSVAAVLKMEPDNREAVRLRNTILLVAERSTEALADVDAFLARYPHDAEAHRDRSKILIKLRQPMLALAAAGEAVRIAPEDSESFVTLGTALNEVGRFDESFEAFERARELGASGQGFLGLRAVAKAMVGDPQEALADFEASLALAPDDAETHCNRAFLRISLGDWAEGWPEYEWRLKLPRYAPRTEVKQIPRWTGEPLAGKRLLVYGEQGHGDTLQFVRYLDMIDRSETEVTFLAQKAVCRLLADNFPDHSVIDNLSLSTKFDVRVSLMSLPAIFRTTPTTLPARIPYLAADPARVTKWHSRIGDQGFRIGVIWQGSSMFPRDRDRSIPLARFAPLARIPGVRLVSVQAMVGLEQLDALPEGMTVERLGSELENNPDGFREMAAIMANLDLLVMSDTGPTHLAGALGRPVWLATSRYPDWRWMREREDTPWYPNMRLFRQATAGDWDGVFARMAGELEEKLRARG
jgi:tetratricopeptide (TPR) repeat protein